MNETLTLDQCKDIVKQWQESPIVRHYSFSDKKLWTKQEEVLWAMRKHKRVAVKSCNAAGKTFIAADVALDWLLTRPNSIVVTTAPTFHQVETILWREIRHACFSAKIPIGANVLSTELKFSDKWYAIGISTDKPVNFQGKHSETGNLLVILDEASGIPREISDIVEALLPAGILAIGNPLEADGFFVDCFKSALWHKITISGQDVVDWQRLNGKIPGLITEEWMKEMADLHGTKSGWYLAHIAAEFPEQDESALIERQWVDRARKGVDEDGLPLDEEVEKESYRILGWDVASKHGECENVIGYRYGHTIPYIKGYLRQTSTFMRDQVETLYTKKLAKVVCVDADGIGENIADIMSEVHIPTLEFHGGYGAKAYDQTKFKNMRTQFYWIVAKKFEKGLYNLKHMDSKEFELLRSQLCCIRQKPDDALGRMQIETKEDLLSRSIKSPDYADCFVLMEYANFMRKMSGLGPTHYGRL